MTGSYSLKTQAAYLVLGKFIAYCIQIITPIILVRLLTRENYGIYRQILFIGSVGLILLQLRIPESLYYFFPRVNGRHDKLLSQTLSLLVLVSSAGTIVFLIIGWIFRFLPREIGPEYVLPIALYLLFESSARLLDHIFILEKKSRLVAFVTANNELLHLILVLGAAVTLKSVLTIAYALIIYSGIRLCVVLVYLIKKYAIRFGISDWHLLNEQIRYTSPLALSSVVALVGTKIDKAIIVALMSAEEFAIYTIGGLGIVTAVRIIYLSVGNVCLPRFGELAIENDFETIRKIWHKMITINAIITFPVVCFLYVFAEEIITFLFTDKYILSANILRINLFLLIMQMLGYGYIPTALGKTKVILAANSIRAAVAVPLSYFFVTKVGLLGGAISFVASFWLNGIIQLRTARKEINVTFGEFLPWKKMVIVTAASLIPALFIHRITRLGMSNISTLLMAGPIYFTVVAVLLRLTGLLDIRDLKNILRKTQRYSKKNYEL